jgi:hypothetical protein
MLPLANRVTVIEHLYLGVRSVCKQSEGLFNTRIVLASLKERQYGNENQFGDLI